MRDNVKILAILNMILGALGLLAGLAIFLVFGGLAGAIGMGTSDREGLGAASLIAGLGTLIALFVCLLALPQIIGGWGLLRYKRWARILMIVVSVVNLVHVPVGTAVGAFGLWILLNRDTERLFDTGGVAYIPPQMPYSTARDTPPPPAPPGI